MALRPELELGVVATQVLQRLREQALAPMGMLVEQGINLGLILCGMNRAGGIDNPAAGANKLESLGEELLLQHLQLGNGGWA